MNHFFAKFKQHWIESGSVSNTPSAQNNFCWFLKHDIWTPHHKVFIWNFSMLWTGAECAPCVRKIKALTCQTFAKEVRHNLFADGWKCAFQTCKWERERFFRSHNNVKICSQIIMQAMLIKRVFFLLTFIWVLQQLYDVAAGKISTLGLMARVIFHRQIHLIIRFAQLS